MRHARNAASTMDSSRRCADETELPETPLLAPARAALSELCLHGAALEARRGGRDRGAATPARPDVALGGGLLRRAGRRARALRTPRRRDGPEPDRADPLRVVRPLDGRAQRARAARAEPRRLGGTVPEQRRPVAYPRPRTG